MKKEIRLRDDERNTRSDAVLFLTTEVLAGRTEDDKANNPWLRNAVWLKAAASQLKRPLTEEDRLAWETQKRTFKDAFWLGDPHKTPASAPSSPPLSSNSNLLVNKPKIQQPPKPWNDNKAMSPDDLDYIRFSG
jgi:hypothetical protein